MECVITHKHTLQILYKSKHFPPRYKRKREREREREGVSFVSTSDKNTHLHFLLYLGGKCFDLYKIFRLCLWGVRQFIKVKIKYSLLPLTPKHFIKCLSSIMKPIIPQTCKHDVRITSSVAMNIYFLRPQNTQFLTNILWKFCVNLNIFHGDIEENVNGCFFLNTVYLLFIDTWNKCNLKCSVGLQLTAVST